MQQMTDGEVEYQWRWARVFGVLSVLVILLIFVTMHLFPSKIPESNKDGANRVQVSQASISTPVENQTELKLNQPAKVSLSQSEVVVSGDKAVTEALVQTTETTSLSPNKEAVESTHLTQPPSDNDVSSQVESSVTQVLKEPLADVALGAKMNTQSVSRALLTREIKAREPIDIIGKRIARASFTKKLYFFTEVNGLKDKTVRHKWYFQDQLQADVALSVYAQRYRTYSSKNIAALQLGWWRVELVAEGKTLASKQFKVTEQ